MGCGCTGKTTVKAYVWTSEDGTKTEERRTEVEVRALQIRNGGSWKPKT